MLLTVIIPTRASEETKPYVEACVASIRQTAPWVEIVVAKNGNHCLDLDVNAEVVYFRKQGQCNAVNEAVKGVGSKYIMVSNDDMIYSPGWANNLMDAVKEHLCVSPTLVEPKGGAEPFYNYDCGRSVDEFNMDKWLDFVGEMFIGENEEDGIEDGFNLPFLVEREVFNTVEGYDTEYDPYGSNSDPDLMYKFMIAGIAPKRDRRSLIYHFSLRSSDPAQSEDAKTSWWKNWRYFPHKWGFERDGRTNIWYAGGENGTRIPTEDNPYVSEQAHGHDIHPGKDWIEYKPDWMGKYGEPFYGKGDYYDQ